MSEASARPIVKWAGGKARLVPEFRRRGLVPESYGALVEGFAGGAALFFAERPERAVLVDANPELVATYVAVRDRVDEVVARLAEMKSRHSKEYYYEVRDWDPSALDAPARAARLLYLNKTCFNGLWRVNASGRFNVPFGRYAKPSILDEANLRAASSALARAEIVEGDFSAVEGVAREGDFVYLDPPYDPVSESASFTSYAASPFGRAEQERLAATFRRLADRGVRVLLSNSDTPFVRALYDGFRVERIEAARAINSRADRRGPVGEVAVVA